MSPLQYLSFVAFMGMLCLGMSTAQACERPAQDAERKVHFGPAKQRCGPPPAALEACEGMTEAAQCSFVGRRDDTLNGQCFTVRDGALACVPQGHRRPPATGEQP